MSKFVYPVTIIQDRYSGTYSGGQWTAFNLYKEQVPDAVDDSDVPCREFWTLASNFHLAIGRGATPDEAFEDLKKRLEDKRSVKLVEAE